MSKDLISKQAVLVGLRNMLVLREGADVSLEEIRIRNLVLDHAIAMVEGLE